MRSREHTRLVRDAWDQYQADYFEFNLKDRPDFYSFFENGGIDLSEEEIELVGDVSRLDLLDTCCAADARQSFSWANLGATVTGCDITPSAIEIASQTANRIGKDVRFVVDDAHTLAVIEDSSHDLVYATYIVWLEDLYQATETWFRVLRPGGRLLMRQAHPLVACLDSSQDGDVSVTQHYFDDRPNCHLFEGTPLADRHGGWGKQVQIVEFFHRVEDMINAVVAAGFRILRVVETTDSHPDPQGEEAVPGLASNLSPRTSWCWR